MVEVLYDKNSEKSSGDYGQINPLDSPLSVNNKYKRNNDAVKSSLKVFSRNLSKMIKHFLL